MSQLEAQMAAEVIAAHLLSEPMEANKLSFLRERAVELVAFLDEQLASLGQAA